MIKGEHKARKEYRITQITKNYYFARESMNKISYFVSYEIQSMSDALHCGRQRVFEILHIDLNQTSSSLQIYFMQVLKAQWEAWNLHGLDKQPGDLGYVYNFTF